MHPSRPGPRRLLACLLAVLAVLAPAASEQDPAAAPAPPSRPHVVVLLVDDVGYGDVGYYGGDVRTPNLDRLAAQGVRLDAFYATQLCTPSRAALLTGRYPLRYGLQHRVVQPDSDAGLPTDERTLAQALKARGYRTAICGKWHLGHARPELLPLARGFDHQYGSYLAAVDYFDRTNRSRPAWYRDQEPLSEEGYTTALIADEAIRHIAAESDAPLFLYVPFTAAHRPLQAPVDAVLDVTWTSDPGRKRFAAVVALLDEAIGRILAALDEHGMARDTLVLFASDNGAVKDGSNGPLRAGKGKLYEGGVRVPAIARWTGVLPAGAVVSEPLHLVDVYPTVLALAGAAPPEASPAQPPLDGRDAWATLAAGAPSPHAEILLNVLPETGALRSGRWKLVTTWGEPPTHELYDLGADPGEARDLAAAHPDVVADLAARLERWRARAAPSVYGARGER